MLLTDSDQPVNDPHDLTFALYDDPVAGNLLWQEVHSAVAFDDGLYTVQLGSNTLLDSVDFNQDLYLGVSVDNDAEMSPRIPIGSVPYAFRADVASSAPWAGLTGVPAGFADGIDDAKADKPGATGNIKHTLAGPQRGHIEHQRLRRFKLRPPTRLVVVDGLVPPVALDTTLKPGIHFRQTAFPFTRRVRSMVWARPKTSRYGLWRSAVSRRSARTSGGAELSMEMI